MVLPERTCLAVLFAAMTVGFLLPGNPRAAQMHTPSGGKQAPDIQHTRWGELLRLRLKSAPFPDSDRQNGYEYGDMEYPADEH
jgi:hypothetical protein